MTAPVTRFDAERAVRLSLGAMSPLWPAYFVAASSSMALWWLSRWTSPLVATTPTQAPKAKPVAALPPPIEVNAVVEAPTVSAAPQVAAKPSSQTATKPAAPAKTTPTTADVAKPASKAKPATPKTISAASAPRPSAKQPVSKA